MKASELVDKLRNHIDTFGDMDIRLSIFIGDKVAGTSDVYLTVDGNTNYILHNTEYHMQYDVRRLTNE